MFTNSNAANGAQASLKIVFTSPFRLAPLRRGLLPLRPLDDDERRPVCAS
jgi:hypothetical protein